MLGWSISFIVLALIAGVLGFTTVAGTSLMIAKVLFFVFLVLFVGSLVLGGSAVKELKDSFRN